MPQIKEKTLLKVSLIFALIGILILIFLSEKLSLESSQISSITNSSIDKSVKVKGTIASIKDTPSVLILTLKDNTGEIKVVAFKNQNITLQKNSIIEVEGIIKQYQNSLEIEAKKITLI